MKKDLDSRLSEIEQKAKNALTGGTQLIQADGSIQGQDSRFVYWGGDDPVACRIFGPKRVTDEVTDANFRKVNSRFEGFDTACVYRRLSPNDTKSSAASGVGAESAIPGEKSPTGQEELLPCPFCGRAPKLLYKRDGMFKIECDDPNCFNYCSVAYPFRKEVVESWNSRLSENAAISSTPAVSGAEAQSLVLALVKAVRRAVKALETEAILSRDKSVAASLKIALADVTSILESEKEKDL